MDPKADLNVMTKGKILPAGNRTPVQNVTESLYGLSNTSFGEVLTLRRCGCDIFEGTIKAFHFEFELIIMP